MEINAGIESVNQDLSDKGHSPMQHGIGIHTGKVVAAKIGSPSRLSYVLVGDTGSGRPLQGPNKQHGTSIIVIAETRQRLSQALPLRPLPDTTMQGQEQIDQIYGL